MTAYETKLKLGRKLEGVDAETASANQASVLFRYTPEGEDKHVSLSIESDAMGVADVVAVLKLLDARGVLRGFDCKTWVSQPQASQQRFGATGVWRGEDIESVVRALDMGLPTPSPEGAPAAAVPPLAFVKLQEAERKLAELRAALGSAPTVAPSG